MKRGLASTASLGPRMNFHPRTNQRGAYNLEVGAMVGQVLYPSRAFYWSKFFHPVLENMYLALLARANINESMLLIFQCSERLGPTLALPVVN
jgi:hypothetical protein